MPPKKNPEIPEGFVASPPGQDKTIICIACAAAAPPGRPIQRTSASQHLKSRDHQKAAQIQIEQRSRQRQAESARAARQAAPEQSANIPRIELHLPKLAPATDQVTEEFWANFDANAADFHLEFDPSPAEVAAREADKIRQALDTFGDLDDVELGYELGVERDKEDLLAENQAREEAQQMEDALAALLSSGDYAEDPCQANDSDWYPYPSKLLFLLDSADNLGRLRISESLMKLFLYILKEAGVKNVPSIGALRKFQKSLRENGSGVPTIRCESVQDKIFYINDVRKIAANDWCNPSVRPHIRVYPEVPEDGIISEMWHGEKWTRNLDASLLSPMWMAPNRRHYYIHELARLRSGKFVIPLRWITQHGRVEADAFEVLVDESGIATVVDVALIEISTMDLALNVHDLEHRQEMPLGWSIDSVEDGYPDRMPHPLRKIAQGRPIYTNLINFFSDNVSGNRSKSWNKHFNCYFTNANLPRAFHQQEAYVHFVSTSQHATVPEQFCEIRKLIVGTHEDPIVVKDPLTQDKALLILGVNVDASDNPMQSEVCSHIGDKGNLPCRKCEVGGTQVTKQTNQTYHDFFSPGRPRNKATVLKVVREQLYLACNGVATHVGDNQSDTGIKDSYAQYWINKIMQDCEEWVKSERTRRARNMRKFEEMVNPFFLMPGHDPTQDTSLEILHIILLGIVKYIWWYSHNVWKDAEKTTYAQRMQATEIDGLNIPPIRANYIMQYANSLIGRQLKAVIQTGVFHMRDLVDGVHYAAWKAVGGLAALLWVPEIDNMAQYCGDLRVAVSNVLDAFAEIDPSKMILKIKLHLLTHLPDDARAFGPLIGVATEIFESFNGVFRAGSILSNHRAPSRDIARQLANQEGARAVALGASWFDADSQEWRSAGPSVKRFMDSQPNLKRMMGLNVRDDPRPGDAKLAPMAKRQAGMPRPERQVFSLNMTLAQNALNFAGYACLGGSWHQASTMIARSGDSCSTSSWIFFNSQGKKDCVTVGQILDLLVSMNDTNLVLAVVDHFDISEDKHPVYGMPQLYRRGNKRVIRIVPAEDVLFLFNAQHDCAGGKCSATGVRRLTQEREETNITEAAIEHTTHARYIINTSAFHNAHLLRRILPRDLIHPMPAFANEDERTAAHIRYATQLRGTTSRKRKERENEAEQKAKEAAAARQKAEELEKAAAEAAARAQEEGENIAEARGQPIPRTE
ncbi:hypothetical protein FB45DRAFT_1028581 [Roridomyces roridus]|uniref:Uncharacterized protein n=1 Tax=Roridomyces roridus TaxID=1738132 RepID=A0AAD7FMA1_9AGAR|nr:hypothetical protein FB45DRAFT_1028581 [Roridomyces roridus]